MLKWLGIFGAILLAGCQTTGNSTGVASANSPHPDLPANYRQQIAEFMRTQLFAFRGIKGAEISEPYRGFAGLINGGDRDIVCVRFGGPGGALRGYVFVDGKLPWDNGGSLGFEGASGILSQRMACGANPNFKPFPEADYGPS